MNKTESLVRELLEEYHSADPEEICEKIGITVLEQELPERVNGFTVEMNGRSFVVLNPRLGYYEKRFTLAHELGHILLHKGTNSFKLSCNTDFCVTKYEREADCFAAWLLMYNEQRELCGMESVTSQDISKIAHIPPKVAESAFGC